MTTPHKTEPPAEDCKIHELKTWPEFFEKLLTGEKTFEIRKNDRGFIVGHVLHLREWNPTNLYTGRALWFRVTYLMGGTGFGIIGDCCVMAIKQIPATEAEKIVGGETFPEYNERLTNSTEKALGVTPLRVKGGDEKCETQAITSAVEPVSSPAAGETNRDTSLAASICAELQRHHETMAKLLATLPK